MKNRTKIFNTVALLVCFVIVLFSLNSCGGFQDFENVHDITEEFIDAVIENDKEEAYELTKGIYTKKEFSDVYAEYRNILKDVDEDYELRAVQSHTEMDNGTRRTSVLYEMRSGNESFVVDVVTTSTEDGIYYIYINEYDKAVSDQYIIVPTTGIPNLMFRLILLAELAFLIVVIVDAARHKIKKKALWIVAIILGGVTVIFMGGNGGLFVRLNLLEILGTYLNTFSDGSFEMGICIPVGAIVYLIMRKKLFRQWEKEHAPKEKKSLMDEPHVPDNSAEETLDDEVDSDGACDVKEPDVETASEDRPVDVKEETSDEETPVENDEIGRAHV